MDRCRFGGTESFINAMEAIFVQLRNNHAEVRVERPPYVSSDGSFVGLLDDGRGNFALVSGHEALLFQRAGESYLVYYLRPYERLWRVDMPKSSVDEIRRYIGDKVDDKIFNVIKSILEKRMGLYDVVMNESQKTGDVVRKIVSFEWVDVQKREISSLHVEVLCFDVGCLSLVRPSTLPNDYLVMRGDMADMLSGMLKRFERIHVEESYTVIKNAAPHFRAFVEAMVGAMVMIYANVNRHKSKFCCLTMDGKICEEDYSNCYNLDNCFFDMLAKMVIVGSSYTSCIKISIPNATSCMPCGK